MKLRRQLLLVSLLVLALPWAGCEYIREMEKTLRQGQQQALEATARAVAARLATDPGTRKLLSAPLDEHALYAHRLQAPPVLDGYDDDWRGLGLQDRVLSGKGGEATLLAGWHDQDLFLFIRMHDWTPAYHTPLQALAGSDHLQLWLQADERPLLFNVYTGAPGEVTVTREDTGERQHRIHGLWQEWHGGYQVELRIPLAWALGGAGVSVVNVSPDDSHALRSFPGATPPPLALRHPRLDEALAVFTGDSSTLLRTASPHRWLIGEAGQYAQQPQSYRLEGNRLLTRIYRLALSRQDFPALDNPRITGRFTSPEVEQALQGQTAARWYQRGSQQVIRVALPVALDGTWAAVVAEQTTDTLRAMTDSAFSRLVSYSLIAFLVAGLGLIAYASWLSWRIRRLSRAAESAVDSNGRINQNFPRGRSRDEIGDLSRSYADLLQRLHQYNTYLETLASKLSHELRTPLAVVRSSLDNLEQEPLPAAAGTYSARARDGAARLSRILDAMSAASRVEQSIQSAEMERVDLRALLEDLVAAYASAYPAVRWQFKAPSTPCEIQAAPDLLVQMLDKLADNAADFCPDGETVEIGLQRQGARLVISVSNPGPALPDRMQGQLFDSLVSVREGPKTGQHLGLGLYIVRLITDFHRGQVSAENRADGSGAIFRVSLPAEA